MAKFLVSNEASVRYSLVNVTFEWNQRVQLFMHDFCSAFQPLHHPRDCSSDSRPSRRMGNLEGIYRRHSTFFSRVITPNIGVISTDTGCFLGTTAVRWVAYPPVHGFPYAPAEKRLCFIRNSMRWQTISNPTHCGVFMETPCIYDVLYCWILNCLYVLWFGTEVGDCSVCEIWRPRKARAATTRVAFDNRPESHVIVFIRSAWEDGAACQ